ncbi:MAG: thioesterase [Pseudonocardiales bacterium]|nr:thioesterase [Pseudonocardiales bacterium]MBV9030155.1 thioesterase [Pseudonocardiales bacterium]MBW0011061.1 thioesterase [Pseudonocardiales bacterium]
MAHHRTSVAARWFRPAGARPGAPTRLFLFPHGGGAAAAYAHWSALLPADVELLLVQLPGRHDRHIERPFTRVEPLLEALREALEAEWDGRPAAFFGHSMGGMLAYRLTVALQRDGVPGPALLGVSSWAPAGCLDGARELSDLSDAELAATVADLGALPAVISASPDMLQVVLPTLRADLAVYGDHVDDAAVVSCPVAAYGGKSDPLLVPGAMALWATRSAAFLGVREFPGGHFYLNDHAVAVAGDLARHLHRQLTSSA